MISDGGFVSKAYIFLIILVVGSMVVVCFWAFWIMAPILVDSGSQATDIVRSALPDSTSGVGNAEEAFNPTIASFEKSTHNLEWIGIALLFAMFFGLLVFMWQIKAHFFLLPVWIGSGVICLFISIIISIQYFNTINNPLIASTHSFNWGYTGVLTAGLPVIVAGFFVVGGIILFALSRGSEEGGTQTL
jgi:hypothetical protein